MIDPKPEWYAEFEKRLGECNTEFDAIVLMCGILLGDLGQFRGVPFDPDSIPPNRWPAIVAQEVTTMMLVTDLTDGEKLWLEGAKKALTTMYIHRGKFRPRN